MKIIKATLDSDSGTVEVGKRDSGDLKNLPDHGYFLGVRPDNASGAFVALTRDEAEELSDSLLERINLDNAIPSPTMSYSERVDYAFRERERANELLYLAQARANKAQVKYLRTKRMR